MIRTLKIIGLLALGLLCLWVCRKASGQPLPPKVKTVLQSPKGAEFSRSLAKAPVAPSVVVTFQKKLLKWDYIGTTNNPASNVVFIIRQTTDLTLFPATNWPILTITQTNSWPITLSNSMCFYRAWSSNFVTGAISL